MSLSAYRLVTPILLISLNACPLSAQAPCAHPLQRLMPYLNDQVMTVVHVNVNRVDIETLFAMLDQMVAPQQTLQSERSELPERQRDVKRAIGEMRDIGVESFYLVLSMIPDEDIEGNLFVAIPRSKGLKEPVLMQKLKAPEGRPELAVQSKHFVFVAHDPVRRTLGESSGVPRPELDTLREAPADYAVRIYLIPSTNTRRILEAMLPFLLNRDIRLEKGALNYGMQWMTVDIHFTPTLAINCHVQSTDHRSAWACSRLLSQFRDLLAAWTALRQTSPDLPAGLALLAPKVEPNGLWLQLNQHQSRDLLVNLVTPCALEISGFLDEQSY